MSAVTTIPVEIEPQAAELVATLGLQSEFDQILDYVRRSVRGLIGLKVQGEDPNGYDGQPFAVILGAIAESVRPVSSSSAQLNEWLASTYPPEVSERFTIFLHYM